MSICLRYVQIQGEREMGECCLITQNINVAEKYELIGDL